MQNVKEGIVTEGKYCELVPVIMTESHWDVWKSHCSSISSSQLVLAADTCQTIVACTVAMVDVNVIHH